MSIGPSGRVALSVGQSQNFDFGAYRFVVTRKADNGNNKSFDIQINVRTTGRSPLRHHRTLNASRSTQKPPDGHPHGPGTAYCELDVPLLHTALYTPLGRPDAEAVRQSSPVATHLLPSALTIGLESGDAFTAA